MPATVLADPDLTARRLSITCLLEETRSSGSRWRLSPTMCCAGSGHSVRQPGRARPPAGAPPPVPRAADERSRSTTATPAPTETSTRSSGRCGRRSLRRRRGIPFGSFAPSQHVFPAITCIGGGGNRTCARFPPCQRTKNDQALAAAAVFVAAKTVTT
jgi:hypothetical protein